MAQAFSRKELRPALEHALAEARRLEREHQGRLPGPVADLVRSRKAILSPASATTLLVSLERNPEFRQQVAATATQEALGRLPWLWLCRPEGWEAEAQLLRREQAPEARPDAPPGSKQDSGEGRQEDRSRRELVRARQRLVAIEDELARANARVAQLAEANRHLRQQLDLALSESRSWERRAGELSQDLEEAHRRLAQGRSQLESLQRHLEAERKRRRKAEAATNEAAKLLEQSRSVSEEALAHSHRHLGEAQAARLSLEQAYRAAQDLVDALKEALGTPQPNGGIATPRDLSEGSTRSRPMPRADHRRRPLPTPAGMLEDSLEAADHLLGVQEVLVVVDGYNVALSSWSDQDLKALRDRLVNALGEFALRRRVPVVVVFDGQGAGGRVPSPEAARPYLKVVFSASEVEADEEILSVVRSLPADQPVVVATDDQEVRHGARALGANVLSVEQLLRVIGRKAS